MFKNIYFCVIIYNKNYMGEIMKITEVNNLYKYLIGAVPIGFGTTAVCFLMRNNKVLKVYYSISLKNIMMSKFEILDEIGNDSYITPEEVLIKDNLCIAQIYPYIKAKTLNKINKNTISELLINYDKLKKDTKYVSDRNFLLGDLHRKNILFNGSYYVIDLDKGYTEERYSENTIYSLNMRKINETILYSIFGIKSDRVVDFYNEDIKKSYCKSLSDLDYFPELLELFAKYSESEDVKVISKKIEYNTSINTYYKY